VRLSLPKLELWVLIIKIAEISRLQQTHGQSLGCTRTSKFVPNPELRITGSKLVISALQKLESKLKLLKQIALVDSAQTHH
jgi:hypothetical protein